MSSVTVNLPTDLDGFLSRECPSCEQIFKALFGEGSDEPLSHCPYCGFQGTDCWHTQEQVEYAKAVVTKALVEPELNKFARSLGSAGRGFLKIKSTINVPEPPSAPIEPDGDFAIVRFPCCNETVKVTDRPELFCIICGAEIKMEASAAKKVFLSHKGVDKQMVRDFKATLELLGYQPWLDEDAMPAGTPLERGLLRGMKESCAVVFFITPAFKDQGYLQSEIDYAMKEKREKGERFAIVTLQFIDSAGNVGEIPELLKHYIWKKPSTPLEAVREIIRALPVELGDVDWREGIVGVVTTPAIKTKTAELSAEAKAILLAAVEGNGTVMSLRTMGSTILQANDKNLIENQDHKSVAKWQGGLEDLQRRRFITSRGSKNEVFEVTREGYEAAESLKST